MAIPTQTISIALSKGLDTKSDPKQVIPASLLRLENGVFTAPNRIQKRNGFVPLTTLTHGIALSAFASELTALDGLNLWSWSEAESAWYNQGFKQTVSVYQQNIFSPKVSPAGPTVTVGPITTLETWSTQSGSQIQYSILDNITKLPLFSSLSALPAGHQGAEEVAIVTGNNFNMIYEDTTGGVSNIAYININSATGVAAAPVNILSEATTTNIMDLCQNPTGALSYIVYTPTGTSLGIAKLDTSTSTITVVSAASLVTTPVGASISYDSTNNYIWIFYLDNSQNLYYTIYDTSLAVILAPTLIATSSSMTKTSIVNAGTGLVFYSDAITSYVSVATCTTLGVVTTNAILSDTHTLYSKPFLVTPPNGNTAYAHIIVWFESQVQSTAFVLRYISGSNYQIIVQIDPGSFFFLGGANNRPKVEQVSPNVFALPYIEAVLASTINPANLGGTSFFAVKNAIIDFTAKPQKVALANNLMYTGGILTSYDGTSNFEQNFLLFPEPINSGTEAGGSLEVGTYGYQVTYEWIDAFGQLQRSAPSVIINVLTDSGDKKVLLQLPILYITNKTVSGVSQVNIVIYRTAVNASTFYKIASIPNTPVTYGDATVDYLDNNPDAAIIGNEQLYTTGGEVPNASPPASDLVTSFKNRVILIPSENPLSWWFSKQVVNSFPVEFSNIFVNNIDQKGGPITAVAAMDDKLIFFKKNLIFYVTGDGPAPNDTANDFIYPQLVATDVGCTDPDSVVLTPNGLMFKSLKGIYLLDRGLSTQYIGAPVEAFNSLKVNSSQLMPNSTQVRFSLADGTMLVYDYFVGQWSEFLNINAVDIALYSDKLYTLSLAGLVQAETPGIYTDNGTAIPLLLQLGRLQLAQVQGFERVKQLLILGQSISPTNLSVSFSYDFSSTVNQTTVIPISASANPLQYRVFLNQQKCESVRITISDSPQAPFGEGLNLSNLALEVGIKKGPYKMPASATYT